MKIGIIQTNPQDNFEANFEKVKKFIEKALKQGTEVLVLPETFTFMGSHRERILCAKKNFLKTIDFLKDVSKTHKVFIVGGSVDEPVNNETASSFSESTDHLEMEMQQDASERRVYTRGAHTQATSNDAASPFPNGVNEKLFNSSYTFGPDGTIISKYQKLHLFNLFDENEHPQYCESDIYFPGKKPGLYTININGECWSALNIICYDIRFPEIVRDIQTPFDILFVPAAFTWKTGQDHWEVLLRARAIENQCYVVACNQTGFFFDNQKRNYGNSMVINPWGRMIKRFHENEEVLVCDIDKSEIKKSRALIPALNDRKIF